MIPILYQNGTKDFTSNGLGRLTECSRFIVTEERNGIYEAEFDYPIDGKLYSQIKEGMIVYATHDDSKDPQPFEIYRRQAPLEGLVTFRAWHISYKLNNVILKPFTASSCSTALAAMPGNSLTGCDFTFWTDKAVSATFKVEVPMSIRAALGGTQGSVLDVYGKGDYEWDGFDVKLWTNRGTDRGVNIRYGKNLVSLDQQFSAANQYNGYIPYWQSMDDGSVVYLDHAVFGNTQVTVQDPLTTHDLDPIQTHTPEDIYVRYGSQRVVPLDLSDYFDMKPTQAELEARAQTLISASDAYEVKENIAINFVQLWQTEEYKDVANLQRIYLCDTVHIYYEKLGINATAKCIKVVYDTLQERYNSMELGEPTTTLTEQVASIVGAETKDMPRRSTIVDAIQRATELITGGYGGYIKYTYLADGTPSEMLVMDSPDEATATNIIRLNQNGLGFSTDGGATYANAWTIDGQLNADFITTGTIDAGTVNVVNIDASEITTGTLSADRIAANSIGVGKLTGTISNGNWSIDLNAGTLTIGDISANKITSGTLNVGNLTVTGTIQDNLTTPKNYWNLTTGQFVTTQGTLGGMTIDTDGLKATETTGSMELDAYGLTVIGAGTYAPMMKTGAGGLTMGASNSARTGFYNTNGIIQLTAQSYTDPQTGLPVISIAQWGDVAGTVGITMSKGIDYTYTALNLTAQTVTVNSQQVLTIH